MLMLMAMLPISVMGILRVLGPGGSRRAGRVLIRHEINLLVLLGPERAGKVSGPVKVLHHRGSRVRAGNMRSCRPGRESQAGPSISRAYNCRWRATACV